MATQHLQLKTAVAQTNVRNVRFRLIGAILGVLVFCSLIWFGLDGELSSHARLAIIVFGLAVAGWIFTSVNATYIALAAAITFTLVGIDEPDEFFEALGDSTIWLLLASFFIAAGVAASGLPDRFTASVVGRAKTVNQLFYFLTAALILTAFVIPATSGRAALMIPVFLALTTAIDDARITKALALLFPTVILLSAVASLIGAGAHLVTAEILWKMGGEQIGFVEWLMLGLPFAIASCLIATFTILSVFLTREERKRKLGFSTKQLALANTNADPDDDETDKTTNRSLTRNEKFVAAVVAALVLLWLTQPLHGVNNTVVAIVGALVLTAPGFGAIGFKEGLKSVNWNLLLFMAATVELGEALIESKAAEWVVQKLFSALHNGWSDSTLVVVSSVAIISLLSHLLITSRTARSAVLIPLIILLAVSLGYNPTTFAFLSTAAAGYCLTLPVSAKPVTMFGQIDGVSTYAAGDLFKLSKYLLPAHFLLLLFFTYFVWSNTGLTLQKQDLPAPPYAPEWYEDLPRDPATSRKAGDGQPRPRATPWAIFGDYNEEENRRSLVDDESGDAGLTASPQPEVEAHGEAQIEPTTSPTPTRRSSPRPRRPRPTPTGDDDDDG